MKNKSFLMILSALIIVVLVLIVILSVSLFKDCSGNNSQQTETSQATNTPDNSSNPTGTPEATATATPTPSPTPTEEPKLLKGVTVYINAGHQGHGMSDTEPAAPWDATLNSKVNNTTYKAKCTSGTEGRFTFVAEHVVNLKIALELQALCEKNGANVVMSRTTADVTKSNVDRALEANNCNADIAIHIHCNGADNQNVSGIEIYTRGNGDNTAEYKARANTDYQLGTSLLDELCEITGANKRSVTKTDVYSTINWANMTSIIVECGFMSNEAEDWMLNSSDYQQKLAQGMLSWLLKNYGAKE